MRWLVPMVTDLIFKPALVLLAICVSPLHAEVTVTRLANEGVIVSDGTTRVMIDGLVVEPYALYGGLPPNLEEQFRSASGVFSDIDLAVASHKHHDHNQPEFACRFMRRSEGTRLLSSLQVLDLMRERCRQFLLGTQRVRYITPGYGEPVVMHEETAEVTAFLLSHGTGKYARLHNFGHLVDMAGMKMVHLGDAAMKAADFETAGLQDVELTAAFIPFWFFQPGPGMEIVERYLDAPYQFALHIPPSEVQEVTEYLAENAPDVIVLAAPGDSMVIPSPRESSASPE